MMKAAAIVGERQAGLLAKPVPKPVGDEVLVKVIIAPMCTEYKAFLAGAPQSCLGHEAVGVVEESASLAFRPGDRVIAMPLSGCGACDLCLAGDYIHCLSNPMQDAAMAQYVLKPSHALRRIPDGMSFERAGLACCGLGASFGAMQKLGVGPFDVVLVAGLGPVGLGAVVNAAFRGARIVAVESNPYRADLARRMGVEAVVDPRDPNALRLVLDASGGGGPTCAVDCSGVPAAHRLCIDAVRRKGKVAFVGECHTETPIVVSRDLIRKGIILVGSWHYNLNDLPLLLQVIERSPIVEQMVTHLFPMSDIQRALETAVSQQSGKIMLKPWE
ncbi:zinc-dependent alcohol dehydrogenase [Paenibacillus sp.]|uniref:zinc-dependent alcohol dehydrogenase n=1 Tax=Paenibacillus sp. TaxID=58172 RepID=UPI002D651263|nr:zinc-binding dehydrogenase [Paenibacillus sp.]HZG88162.1 zinc-binding dehydrogenase [Paenibacillus sp.]